MHIAPTRCPAESIDLALVEAEAAGRVMGVTKIEYWTTATGFAVSDPSVEWTASGIDSDGLWHVAVAATLVAALHLLAANLRR